MKNIMLSKLIYRVFVFLCSKCMKALIILPVILSVFLLFLIKEPYWQKTTHDPSVSYRWYWKPAPSQDGDKFASFLVLPLLEERLTNDDIILETLPKGIRRHNVFVNHIHRPTHLNITFIHRSLVTKEMPMISKGEENNISDLASVADYFEYLHTPQIKCTKLVRLGGTLTCDKGQGDGKGMDGHKYICLDRALELTKSREPNECLLLSYGTKYDTTFDEAVSDLPCEVHMFDVLNFNPQLAMEIQHVYFHNEGLGERSGVNFYNNINVSADVYTLRAHVIKYALYPRLIHILKVDIEGAEWDVFKNIATDPIMDAVGQLALEVHVGSLVAKESKNNYSTGSVPREKWLETLQERYKVLRMIESRGFRLANYEDNIRDEEAVVEEDGTRHEASGELLYINTNWYNKTFRNYLHNRGFRFLDVNLVNHS